MSTQKSGCTESITAAVVVVLVVVVVVAITAGVVTVSGFSVEQDKEAI